MNGLDTNVLIRYLLRDDEPQYQAVAKLVDAAQVSGEPLLIGTLVVLETEWVLRSRYNFTKERLLDVFEALLDTRCLSFDDEPTLERALHIWKDNRADFADCFILAHYQKSGCSQFVTFDRTASALPGARLLQV